MMSVTSELQLNVMLSDLDEASLDRLMGTVRRDLRELGVMSVERVAADVVPPGAKGADSILGALALVVAPVLLPQLVTFFQALVLRGENRMVRIKTPEGLEIEFTPEKRLSEDDVVALVRRLEKPLIIPGL